MSCIISLGRCHSAGGMSGDLIPRFHTLRSGHKYDEPYLSETIDQISKLQTQKMRLHSTAAMSEHGEAKNISDLEAANSFARKVGNRGKYCEWANDFSRVMLCESAYPDEGQHACRQRREQILERVMEEFFQENCSNFQRNDFFLCHASTMALFSVGLQSGVVVDLGHTQSTVHVIENGFHVPHAHASSHVTGFDLSMKLSQINANPSMTSEGFSSAHPEEPTKKLSYEQF